MSRWTEEEDGVIRQLWAQGKTLDLIAERTGRTRGAVCGRLDRLGLLNTGRPRGARKSPKPKSSSPKCTDEQVRKLRYMRADGSLNREIASALGKSEVAIKAKIKALAAPSGEWKWQWKRRDGSPANRHGRNTPRSIMKPADGADAAACMAEVRDAIDALTARCCRWPIGDVGKPGFRFCGARKETLTGPYCAKCTERAWRPLKPRVFRDTALASDMA